MTMSSESSPAQNKKATVCEQAVDASHVGVSYCKDRNVFSPYWVLIRTRRRLDGGISRCYEMRCKETAPRSTTPRSVPKRRRVFSSDSPSWELPLVWLLFLFSLSNPEIVGFSTYLTFLFWIFTRIVLRFLVYMRQLLRRVCWWLFIQTLYCLEPQMFGGNIGLDRATKEVIYLSALFVSLSDSKSRRGMIAAIATYLQAHSKKSLPATIYDFFTRGDSTFQWSSANGIESINKMLDEAFDGTIEEREDENGGTELIVLQCHSTSGPKVEIPWHIAMDRAFSNWKDLRNGALATKFFNLVNVLVCAGLCSAASLDFRIGNVKVFSDVAMKKQVVAADVFEAFYESISCFLKGGWYAYKTGEFSAFFTEDDSITAFEKNYVQICQVHGYAIAGNLLEYTDLDDNSYDKLLKESIELGDQLAKRIKKTQLTERSFVTERLDKIRRMDTEFTQLRTRGGLRVSPFAISLFGQSGCGKSTLTSLTVNAGLLYNGLDASKERITTWADNDKYASSVRSHINAIIFDDFANTKEEFMDFSPAYRLIQVINNIRYLAPMADVFLKGKVSLNPYFCIVSTNVRDLCAARYSNEPESVLRRLYHVKVIPKPEFCTNGILDKAKIEARFGVTQCPDVWLLTICTYQVRNKRHVSNEAFTPIVHKGKTMVDVSVVEYLDWVQEASKRHFEEERAVISCQESIPTRCEQCSKFYCRCASPEVSTDTSSVESDSDSFSNRRNQLRAALESGDDALPPDVAAIFMEEEEELRHQMHEQKREWRLFELQNQSGTLSDTVSDKLSIWFITCYDCVFSFNIPYKVYEKWSESLQSYYKSASSAVILSSIEVCNWWERWDMIPEAWVCHPKVLQLGLFFWRNEIKQSLISGNSFIALCTIIATYCSSCSPFLARWLSVLCILGGLWCGYFFTCCTIQTYRLMIRDRMLELRDFVKTYLNSWEMKYALLAMGAVVGILVAFRRNVKAFDISAQSGLSPECIADIARRNNEDNPWLVVNRHGLPMSEPSKTTTCTNLATAMSTNIVGVVSDSNKMTLGFFIHSNFLLVPKHFVDFHGDRDIGIKCYRTSKGKVGSYFRDKISVAFRVEIEGTDFVLCYVTSGGSMKDFRKFLPIGDDLRATDARLVTRGVEEDLLEAIPAYYLGSSSIKHDKGSYPGGYYRPEVVTFEGMCMSPVISNGRGSVILGFHLGGGIDTKNRPIAGCGTLTIYQANDAIEELSSRHGVVLSTSSGDYFPLTANMGDFPVESFGKKVLESEDIHYKSATRFMREGACMDVYGSTIGRAKAISKVVPTIIASSVKRIFDTVHDYGPPCMKGPGVYPFQATLEHAAIPSLPIGSVMAKAVECYKSITAGVKSKIPELFACGPLSRVATVSGLKGVKFIDPMNFSTSPGFPLGGDKRPYLVDLDPEEYPDIGHPRTFVKEIWDEFDKVVATLRTGKRCYAIWKACLKDEVTKTTKKKVRVFQSAPLVIQLLIRMYFLPIVRIIQMNPIAFECAVGVNAEGLEWEELWEAAMSKGRERVFAGDYSKYDVRMPAQVTCAAFDVLIDIASQCEGYTTEDIALMRALVHEVVYPVVAYNGDLIQLFGTNPSGQNLTVIINSIANSLLLRSYFYSLYPTLVFKEHCAIMTYGDDIIGSVSEFCKLFTIKGFSEWCGEHDMGFTMPNKEDELVDYMEEKDVDFLKRKSEYNPDLGRKVGLLSEDSILKRLLACVRSSELSPEEHSAVNIESSLNDYFYYGRDIFEDRFAKLYTVAGENGILHLCPGFSRSYDDRVIEWRQKYLDEEKSEPESPILKIQCGDLYVSTVDYTDHCIGTAYDIYFWWEHIAAQLTLPFLFFLCYLAWNGWTFTIGMPDKRWLFVYALLGGGRSIFRFVGYHLLLVAQCTYMLYFLYIATAVIRNIFDFEYQDRVAEWWGVGSPRLEYTRTKNTHFLSTLRAAQTSRDCDDSPFSSFKSGI